MDIGAVIAFIIVVLAGYKQYQRQEYWLDRQVAKLIGKVRLWLKKLAQ